MASRWFKHDAGARNDPELVRLSITEGPEAIVVWWNLLEVCCAQNGPIQTHHGDPILGRVLGIPHEWNTDVERVLDSLADRGKVVRTEDQVSGEITYWPTNLERYFQAPSARPEAVAERVRKHRASNDQGNEGRNDDVTVTETTQIREEESREEEKRGKRLVPENYEPSEKAKAWAIENHPHLDLATETSKFIDWYRANGKRIIAFDSAWRNWIRKAAEFNPPPPPRPELVEYVAPPKVPCKHGPIQCEECRQAAIRRARELGAQTVKSA